MAPFNFRGRVTSDKMGPDCGE